MNHKTATLLAMPPPIQNVYTGDDNSTLVSEFKFLFNPPGQRSQKLQEKITKKLRRKLKNMLPVLMTLGMGSISSSMTKGSGLGKTCTSAVRWPHLRTAWKGVYARSISFLEDDD